MTATLPKQPAPLITPVRAVWVGITLQSISDEVFRLAVVWMAIGLVGTAASALPAIQYFCAFFIGMTAGAIADRFAPRTTMVDMAAAASATVRRRMISKAWGNRVWSITSTDQPSSLSQMVR